MTIDRRRVLAGTAGTLFALALGSPHARAAMREKTRAISATAIPAGEAREPYPFELFYDLSRYLTLRADLDRKLAQAYFDHFSREKWGASNAARFYAILRRELDGGVGSAPELLMSGRLAEPDEWYARHIANAWYDGFYRYEGAAIRVTYEKALMWEAVRDLVPVQGLSDAAYGFWSRRPQLTGGE